MKSLCSLIAFVILALSISCQKETSFEIPQSENDTLAIFSFAPDSVAVGEMVMIRGVGFDTSVSENKVIINNVLQNVIQASDSLLIITIAEGSTSGQFEIEVKGKKVVSTDSIRIAEAPIVSVLKIESFSPESAKIGDTILIKGKGFGTSLSEIAVFINQTKADVIDVNDSLVTVKVGLNTTTGNIVIENDGQIAVSEDVLNIIQENPWIRRADFPANWDDFTAVSGISVNDRGYFLKGDELWEYSPSQDAWQQKALMPGRGFYSFSFSVNNRIYIGSNEGYGIDSIKLWEYDIASNAWNQKRSLPIAPRIAPLGFAANNIGYVGGGQISFDDDMHAHDFWKYNPQNDTWQRLADFPGEWTVGICGFNIGNEGYVYDAGLGFPQAPTSEIGEGRLWRYDATSNSWIPKASCPGGVGAMSAAAFSIGNKGYIAVSVWKEASEPTDNFWMYDPSSDIWTKKTDVGGGLRWFGSGFSIGNKGYIGLGSGDTEEDRKNDFWEYTPE